MIYPLADCVAEFAARKKIVTNNVVGMITHLVTLHHENASVMLRSHTCDAWS